MVHHLKMPSPLAGLQIDADQALTEQVVAWPLATVEVGCRRFNRQIDEAELFIYGHLSPYAGVAVGGPGAVPPCFVANLAGARDRVEGPQEFAVVCVVGAYQTFGVVMCDDRHAFFERRSDDYHILNHERSGMKARLAVFQIDLFAGAGGHADLEVHHSVPAEARDGSACVGVQLYEPVTGSDEDDPIVALAVGPVRDAAAGKLPGRDGRALAFAE